MGNRWLDHVRDYSKKYNISFACALSLKACRDAYKSHDDIKQENIKLTSNNFARELKNMKDENKPLLRMRFNKYSKQVQEHIEKQYPNLLKELKSK